MNLREGKILNFGDKCSEINTLLDFLLIFAIWFLFFFKSFFILMVMMIMFKCIGK